MNKQLAVWKKILACLQSEIPVMLLYVVDSRGSSPGRRGFFMAVPAEGNMEGSIGGGIMEHKFVELAKDILRSGNHSFSSMVKKQVHDKSAARDQSGMICSGEQTVLLYMVKDQDQKAISNLVSSLEGFRRGTLELGPAGIAFRDSPSDRPFLWEPSSASEWFYSENTGYGHHLFIIGGGHCALALSKLVHGLDFFIHVYDHRNELHTLDQNVWAHTRMIVPGYTSMHEFIPEGSNHFVVIMTLGYRTDMDALKSLLGKSYHYLGLLGSKKKVEKMFEELIKEGVPQEVLQTIHAPVGIDIKSETPEEIAISIAAELIREKAKRKEG
jgi:xanthine dehydrogenase accessory factor